MRVETWGPLAGRTVAVTGGASGIGGAITTLFAQAGARGAVLDVQPASQLPDGWIARTGDVRDAGSLTAAFDAVGRELGSLDVLVAAAGVVPPWSRTATLDLDEWDEVMAVNARGVAATLLHALPVMRDGASIVVIASLDAWKGDPNLIAYAASKHAALGVVRSAALDLGTRGIRVNAVAPGPVATEALLARMRRRAADQGPSVEDALAAAAHQTALGRIATPEDVAAAALFLASDLSSAITGQLLPVDGGLS
jgi:NAD(P)-dependent dehydrogenase (short-subunit alcohol dehydrogenase family)